MTPAGPQEHSQGPPAFNFYVVYIGVEHQKKGEHTKKHFREGETKRFWSSSRDSTGRALSSNCDSAETQHRQTLFSHRHNKPDQTKPDPNHRTPHCHTVSGVLRAVVKQGIGWVLDSLAFFCQTKKRKQHQVVCLSRFHDCGQIIPQRLKCIADSARPLQKSSRETLLHQQNCAKQGVDTVADFPDKGTPTNSANGMERC